jgi:hypothetical protein
MRPTWYDRPVRSAVALALLVLAAAAPAEEPEFDLIRGAAPKIAAGKPAALSISIAPRPAFRLLKDAPIELRASADGMSLPRPALSREGAVDPLADVPRFEVPVIGGRPGPAHVRIELTFYLCRAARCRPVKAEASWDLEVLP